jgi:hypothetical protein
MSILDQITFQLTNAYGAEICIFDREIADAFDDFICEELEIVAFQKYETNKITFYIASLQTDKAIAICLEGFCAYFDAETNN